MSSQTSERVLRAATSRWRPIGARLDRSAGSVFILPAVLVILGFSIFPLLASLYVSLSRLSFSEGGVDLKFVGLDNYAKLIVGVDQTHFLGVVGPITPVSIAVLAAAYGLLALLLYRYITGPNRTAGGLVGRVVTVVIAGALLWLIANTILTSGRPGTLVVTIVYVGVDVAVQYLLGLGLALLVVQHLPGRRFFRVVFLLPMMITPVGVAYLFQMLTDTSKGPLYPLWARFGLTDVSWVTNPWGARLAVMIGDVWQWTPFIFIILLAAIETLPHELVEAAVVDGASRWNVFWRITFPQILPATTTVVLIRLIEGFKIIDLPNVLTNGGPGTATESLTLHAYTIWRALDIGGSAAVAYMLLLLVTFVSVTYVNLFRRRVAALT
ncbi:MAG: sugar ABC transporter permease [Chloroflexi bacterium]|nr:MAG: transporter [Actinobacteria bacterium 13_1_20CM_2_66_18]TMF84687.1 MAG: sugar ABC transporter permease [Chloroflexota bacterium]TMG10011.1 MAG: sugar ABC transporter permease [Chloroflexota bacterium]